MDKRKIVIIDDDANLRETLSDILHAKGYAVEAFAKGEEALNRIQKEKPAVALIDLKLKGMSGLEVMEKTKELCPSTKCIILTGYASEKSAIEAVNLGAYSYEKKPYDIEQLLLTIRRAIEKQETEEALRKSEEKFRTLTESTSAMIMIYQNCKCIYANPTAEKITGYTAEELSSMKFWDFLHPDYKDIAIEGGKAIERGESPPSEYVSKIVTKDLEEKWIDVRFKLFEYKGKSTALISAIEITERKRMEQELRRLDKLESVGTLAGGIAHDFNNLLTSIFGNIQLAKMESTEENVTERLTKAEKACGQTKNLTQRLLTFSKGGTPVIKAASISEFLKETAEFTLIGSNVRYESAIPDDLWLVEIDTGQINQVIQNLIVNADQAMPSGGMIKVRAENTVIGAENALPLEDGKYVKIEVEDEGIGIPEKIRPNIFDPYFSTKGKGADRGSGLGLAICHSVVTQHDGHITVESETGVGTTFYIYLPASEEQIPEGKKEASEELPSGEGKILVMDDEEGVRDVASAIINSLGYTSETAEGGSEAIELYKEAKEAGEPFDAVILDLTVPGGMGGEEAIQKLREIDANVTAIVSSGYANDPIMSDYEQYGFSGVFAKPYKIKKLSEVLPRC